MRWPATCTALTLVVTGCGSRSPLRVDEISRGGSAGALGGAGGSVSFGGTAGNGGVAGSSGVGGAGGSAGSVPECSGIQLGAPIATIDPEGGGQDTSPELVWANEEGSVVTAVFSRELDASFTVLHASVSPWTNWMTEVPTTFLTADAAPLSPVFAAGPGINGSFPVLVRQPGQVPFLVPNVPASGNGPVPSLEMMFGDEPAFVANGSAGTFVGMYDGPSRILISVAVPKYVPNIATLACASEQPLADAEPIPGGWLMAASTGQLMNTCKQPYLPPHRIEIVRNIPQGGSAFATEHLALLEVGATVQSLATAPHGDGMWIVWKSMLASGPRIEWALYRQSTGGITRGTIGSTADVPLELAAGSLGDSLIVAWSNDATGDPLDLVVTVLDDSGQVTATTAIEAQFFGPISVVGSPAGSSAVVAWGSSGYPQRIQLARFDCL